MRWALNIHFLVHEYFECKRVSLFAFDRIMRDVSMMCFVDSTRLPRLAHFSLAAFRRFSRLPPPASHTCHHDDPSNKQKMGNMVSLQGSIQSKLHPATWIPGIRNVHSEECEWAITAAADVAIDTIFTAAEELGRPNFVARSKSVDKMIVVIDTFTKAKWMDQIRVTVTSIDDKSCRARVVCSSTGFLPLIIPLAPVLNAALCFLPFGDGGKCAEAMKLLKEKIEEISSGVTVDSRVVRRSVTNPSKE